uniref:K Homology domain-containing protein n=1 Tax=Haptolina ericina TaxID=156174 RepID=A0A7S3ATV9_9EUKA
MEESNSRIRISAMDEILPVTRERIATIAGTAEALLRAQQLISAVLAEPRQGDTEAVPTERTLKLLMPNGAIGAVIGKGGTVIKEIMMQTGAHLKIAQPAEAIPQTQERVLTLTGTVLAIDSAQNEIVHKLAAAPPGQQIKETDYKVLKGSGLPQYPQIPMGAPYGMPWMQQGHRALPPAPGGGPMSYKQFMSTLADDVSPEEAQRQYQDYLRSVGGGPGLGGGSKSTANAANAITQQMPLPDKIVSGIIGKGGIVIKEIINRSGAEVKISQKDSGNQGSERIVSITGAPESVAAAQRLISDRCRDIEQQIARAASGAGGFPSAPASATSFAPPAFGYDNPQLGYCMQGMGGYAQPPGSQFNSAPGFGALGGAAQQQYGYACQPPAAGTTPW